MPKITLEDIKNTLKNSAWSCESKNYVNLKTPMTFRCPEGHLVENTWEKMRNKQVCPVCKANLKKKIVNIDSKPKTEAFRVLALDQSSNLTGYSIYDNQSLISYGVFETSKSAPFERIVELCDWLQSMLEMWKPDLVGLEDIQYRPGKNNTATEQNHNTFKLLGQVMGGLIVTIARSKCKVDTVLIPTWRGHCKVKGNTRVDQKRSAQLLVKQWYDITVTDDESDAICIGKYFADRKRSEVKIGIGEY